MELENICKTYWFFIVGNATQNDAYFSIGRSSKFDPFLTSLYLTFLTAFEVLASVRKILSIMLLQFKSCSY